MAYFEGITPTDIELYDASGLGKKIRIWLGDLVLFFGIIIPSLDSYAWSDAMQQAQEDMKSALAAAEKAYDNFKISHPECKCGFGEFRRACRYKSERLAKLKN